MEITTELIKKLREETSVSVMQCKKALEEADGDYDKAILILKKKSSEVAAKKSDRETGMGILVMRKNDTKAVIVELNCETDFVAKNDDFVNLANKLADLALETGKDATVEQSKPLIDEVIQKVGENIVLGNIIEITGSPIGGYVHDGRIATIVTLTGGDDTLAKDIAMHIAAMNPEYKEASDIPADTLAKIRLLFATFSPTLYM
jgi:elongation factor Ts